MTNFCINCDGAITPTTPSTKCGSCKKYSHLKCLKLSDAEIANIISEKSSWVCHNCDTTDDNTITIAKIEAIIKSQLSIVRNEIKESIDFYFKSINERLSAVENTVRTIQEGMGGI